MAARPDFRSFSTPAYRQRAFAARLQRVAVQTHRHTPTTDNLTTLVSILVHINRDLDANIQAIHGIFAECKSVTEICITAARLKDHLLTQFGLTTDSYLTVMHGRTTPRWVARRLAELGANP